jgi:hypothetical protein
VGDIIEFLSFCERVDSLDESESSTLTWRVARRNGQALNLHVLVETRLEEIPDQSWEIRVNHAREIELMDRRFAAWSFSYDDLTYSREHVLLWGYKDLVSQLNFTGPSGSHERLLWDLYERHRKVTGDWIPFDRYLNGHFIHNRLSGGHGVLAAGPDRLVQEYASVLRGSDLEPYFPYPPHLPVRVYGTCGVEELLWEAEDADLSVLVLFDSYVVGTGFSAHRV